MADYPNSTGVKHYWWETLTREVTVGCFLPSDVGFFYVTICYL